MCGWVGVWGYFRKYFEPCPLFLQASDDVDGAATLLTPKVIAALVQGDAAVRSLASRTAAEIPAGTDDTVSFADFEAWFRRASNGASASQADQRRAVPRFSRASTLPLLTPLGEAAPNTVPNAPPSSRQTPPSSPLTLLFTLHDHPAQEVIEDFAAVATSESLLPRQAFVRRMLRYLEPAVLKRGLEDAPETIDTDAVASVDPDVRAVVSPRFIGPVQRVLDSISLAFQARDSNGNIAVDFVDFAGKHDVCYAKN